MIMVDTPHGKVDVLMIEEFAELERKTKDFLEKNDGKCPDCGDDLVIVKVNHPSWDSPHYPTQGSGSCITLKKAHCIKCQGEPEYVKGSPVATKGSFHYKEPALIQ
jgi:hypothetical protein